MAGASVEQEIFTFPEKMGSPTVVFRFVLLNL
jgi:hypothetical protein